MFQIPKVSSLPDYNCFIALISVWKGQCTCTELQNTANDRTWLGIVPWTIDSGHPTLKLIMST